MIHLSSLKLSVEFLSALITWLRRTMKTFTYSCVVPGDFMKEGEVYEDLSDFAALKKYMEDQLEDYNMEPGVIPMNLVLFRDAIEHGQY